MKDDLDDFTKCDITPVDLEFRDLRYSVPEGRKREIKHILKGVSGKLCHGSMTAIMGPSGAGKSSLMNILAGYRTRNVTGDVLVNGRPRVPERFRKLSCYIMQDDHVLGQLTVEESMMYSASLRLPPDVSIEQKRLLVHSILVTMGMAETSKTRAVRLSGGQRKRLSIALELVRNPPIMFFDEPTSGLDSSTCYQCVTLLRKLARGGRTIICTIHQPSARVFEQFDYLYFLADGFCLYRGAVRRLVDYLESPQFGLRCPTHHNPSDYVMEVACGEHGRDHVHRLRDAVHNEFCDAFQYAADMREQQIPLAGAEGGTVSALTLSSQSQTQAHPRRVPAVTNTNDEPVGISHNHNRHHTNQYTHAANEPSSGNRRPPAHHHSSALPTSPATAAVLRFIEQQSHTAPRAGHKRTSSANAAFLIGYSYAPPQRNNLGAASSARGSRVDTTKLSVDPERQSLHEDWNVDRSHYRAQSTNTDCRKRTYTNDAQANCVGDAEISVSRASFYDVGEKVDLDGVKDKKVCARFDDDAKNDEDECKQPIAAFENKALAMSLKRTVTQCVGDACVRVHTDSLVTEDDSEVKHFEISSWQQFRILTARTSKCIVRDSILTQLQFGAYAVVGLLLGLLYYNVGNDGYKVRDNISCLFFSTLFVMFASIVPTVLTFPIEMGSFRFEHLNDWYSIRSYYFAKSLADFPFQVIFPIIFGVIVYVMTGQPFEFMRYCAFQLVLIETSVVSQSLGLLVGAACSLQTAIFIGPIACIPLMLFSGYFIGFETIPSYLQWCSYADYIRYAFEGVLLSIFGSVWGVERHQMTCDESSKHMHYCVDTPSLILLEMGVPEGRFSLDLGVLLVFFLLFRFTCYLALRSKSRAD